MATYKVGKGLDDYIAQLGNLAYSARDDCGAAIYEGAKIVADEIHGAIQSAPLGSPKDGKLLEVQRRGLLDGLGIAAMRMDGGYLNVKIGMDGYNALRTKKFPKGQPNALIARALESGTSWSPANPIISRATRSAKAKAEEKMRLVIDERIRTKL